MFKSSLLTIFLPILFALLIPLSLIVDTSPKMVFYFQAAAQNTGHIVVGKPLQITGYISSNNIPLKNVNATFFYVDSGEGRNCLMEEAENGNYKFIVTFKEPGIHDVTIFAQYRNISDSFSWDINVEPK